MTVPALRESAPPATTEGPRFTITDMQVLAQQVARSRMFGMDESQAFTLMMVAHSKGLHPIAAMERYHVIQGRPAMKADAMLADFQAKGGRITWKRHDHEACEATFEAPGVGSPVTIAWTMIDAKKAGLGGKDMWAKYPRQMLRARVISEGIRMTMPGIISGIYTPEEVADFAPDPHPAPAREHHATNLHNNTGHGRTGAYAKPESVAEYRQWLEQFVAEANAKWFDRWTHHATGELHPDAKELLSTWQVTGHLVKWGRETGVIEAPAEPRSRQLDPLAAILWERAYTPMIAEAKRYGREKWREAASKLAPTPEPEAEPIEAEVEPDPADDCDPDIDYPSEPGSDG